MMIRKRYQRWMACGVGIMMLIGMFPTTITAESKKLYGEAIVKPHGYTAKVIVTKDSDGTITKVEDDATQVPQNNQPYWNIFVNADGFGKYQGKKKETLDEVDVVASATNTSKAIKEAVKKALDSENPVSPQEEEEQPKASPGVHTGEAEYEEVKAKVEITVGEDGRIKSIKDNGTEIPYLLKSKGGKHFFPSKGEQYYLGKSLRDVLAMDVDTNCSAFIPYGKTDYSTKSWKIYCVGIAFKKAVLQAMGSEAYNLYELQEKERRHSAEGVQTFSGTADVRRYDYFYKLKVSVNQYGYVTKVKDDGTNVQTNYVTTDNKKRIVLFEEANGYEKFVGKNATEIQNMDIGYYGIDVVSGATWSEEAAQRSVLDAMSKGNFRPSGEAAPSPAHDQVYSYTLNGQQIGNRNEDVTMKVYVNKKGRVAQITASPGGYYQTTQGSFSNWDKFVKHKGFYKFYGMNLEDMERTVSGGTITPLYTAGQQKAASQMVRDNIYDALQQYERNKKYTVTVNGQLQGEYSEGEEVTVSTPEKKGEQLFKKWEITTGPAMLDGFEKEKAETSFRMPRENVVLSSSYEQPPAPPQPPAARYKIRITPDTSVDFGKKDPGYEEIDPYEITLKNIGNRTIKEISVELSGTDAEQFELSAESIDSISVRGEDRFTVRPKTGLSTGKYQATLTVSANRVSPTSIDLFFEVVEGTPKPEYKEWESRQDVPVTKKWRIRFNQVIDASTLTAGNCYILLEQTGEEIPVTLTLDEDGRSIIVIPKKEFQPQTDYVLFIQHIQTTEGKLLKENVKMRFQTK